MRKRRQAIEANNFLGLNERAETRMLTQYFRSGKNFFITDDAFVEKVRGTRKIYEGHNFDEIYSLYYHKENNSVLLATGLEGSTYKMKVYEGGSWTDKSLPSEVGSKHFDEYPVWYASYLNEPYIFTGEMSLVYQSTSTKTLEDLDTINYDWFIANGGSSENYVPIRGISPIIHFNALWIAGIGDWKNIVMYTQNFNNIFYNIKTGNIPRINYKSIGGDDSAASATLDEITVMLEWGPEIVVFKNNSMHRITGYTSTQYTPIPINSDIGCKYPQSAKRMRSGIVWLDDVDSGVWMYSGGAPKNISRPMVDSIIREAGPDPVVRSGVLNDRYYLLSLGRNTLVYDTDLNSWSVQDVSYGSFARVSSKRDFFLAAKNTYTETKQSVTDPARPGEPQEVLQKIATGADILELDRGAKREQESDGSGGEDIDFEIVTPYLDAGSRRVKKTFYEVMVHFKSGDRVLYLDVDIDGILYKDLKGSIDPRPLYQEAYYNEVEFDRIPLYETKFLMPIGATGYSLSLKFHNSTGKKIRIEDYVVYFLPRSTYKEERE